jgi:acyl carrier protein phosphodiesterase
LTIRTAIVNFSETANLNYLAHAYLSFNDPDVLCGNMISDYIKGRKQYDYPARILVGIKLHRFIDDYTDRHPVIHDIKQLFRPAYGLYAGAFMDVIFDFFLARDESRFAANELAAFAERTYLQLAAYEQFFPARFAGMFPYMRDQNWLLGYRDESGIEKSLAGLVRRARYMYESGTAFRIFQESIPQLQAAYDEFFPQLYEHTLTEFYKIAA